MPAFRSAKKRRADSHQGPARRAQPRMECRCRLRCFGDGARPSHLGSSSYKVPTQSSRSISQFVGSFLVGRKWPFYLGGVYFGAKQARRPCCRCRVCRWDILSGHAISSREECNPTRLAGAFVARCCSVKDRMVGGFGYVDDAFLGD